MLRYALDPRSDGTIYSWKNWEIYNDPGSEHLQQKHRVNDVNLPIALKKVIIPDMYLKCNVKLLDENTVYFSRVHNYAMLDYFFVCHHSKMVDGYNATERDVKDHKFRLQTIATVLKDLQMDPEGDGKDYTLRLFVCVGWHKNVGHGMRFKATLKNGGEATCSYPELVKMAEMNNCPIVDEEVWVIKRLKLHIIRFNNYPNMEKKEITSVDKEK